MMMIMSVAEEDELALARLSKARSSIYMDMHVPEQVAEQIGKHHMDKQKSVQLQHWHPLRHLFLVLKLCV